MAAPSGYSYYKEITVQDANVDANLTDFPALIQIVDDSDIGGNIVDDTNGYDIRFYDVDADAELKFDRIYFDVTAGDCNATFYVKSALYASPAGDQNKIRIYYGKAADSDGEDAANTWDANFVGVWPMNDASGTIVDATGSHSSDSESITDYQAAGKIRYAVELVDASSDQIHIADHGDLTLTAFTMSGWFNCDGFANADILWKMFDATSDDGFWAYLFDTDIGDEQIYGVVEVADSQLSDATTKGTAGLNAWHHLTMVREADGDVILYIEGVADGSFTNAGEIDSSSGLYFGRSHTAGNYFDGHFEGFRLSNVARPAAWVKFEVANADPGDYELTWGSETSATVTYTIECTAGTYAVTGATLNALFNRKAICTAGAYAVTGATLNPLYGRRATCATGVYGITGAQLDPVYQENVTITPAVFTLELVFLIPNITLGAAVKGSEFHMFMDMSMN